MTIKEIYSKYQILPNLQQHMFWVTAVGEWICRYWSSPKQIDPVVIRTTLLLHDMGNILKFDLNAGLELLGDESKNLEYWLKVQQDFKSRYGSDEHQATYAIAQELSVCDQVITTLKNMGSNQASHNLLGSDFNVKICTYADMRVAPYGLVSIDERFDDGIKRYQGRSSYSFEQAQQQRASCLYLESQLQINCKKPLTAISQTVINNLTKYLLSTDI